MAIRIYWVIYLGCFGITLACNTNKPVSIRTDRPCEDCSTYKDYIRKNWTIDSTGYFVLKGKPDCLGPEYIKPNYLYQSLMGRKCFEGQPLDSIVRYFGSPTTKTENRFDYYLNKRCEGKDLDDIAGIRGCLRLRVYFDEKNMVVGVSSLFKE